MLEAILVFADILVVGCVLYVNYSNGINIRAVKKQTEDMVARTKEMSKMAKEMNEKINNKP